MTVFTLPSNTLAQTLWPSDNAFLRNVTLAVLGSIALWISAKISIPFWPVPLTMQTLVVLMIGMASRPNEELARIRMLNMSVEDVIRGKLNEEALRRVGIDIRSLEGLNRDILGVDQHERRVGYGDPDTKEDQE